MLLKNLLQLLDNMCTYTLVFIIWPKYEILKIRVLRQLNTRQFFSLNCVVMMGLRFVLNHSCFQGNWFLLFNLICKFKGFVNCLSTLIQCEEISKVTLISFLSILLFLSVQVISIKTCICRWLNARVHLLWLMHGL